MNVAQRIFNPHEQNVGDPGSVRLKRRGFLKLGLLATSALSGGTPPSQINLSLAADPSGAAEELPTLGEAAQLFVDLDRVESLDNVKQVFHSAEKHAANPVLRKVKLWENDRGTWGSVIYDEEEKLFKAWYGGASGARKEFRPGSLSDCSVLCYATSRDGIDWERPELGLCAIMGSRKNNVIISDYYHNGLTTGPPASPVCMPCPMCGAALAVVARRCASCGENIKASMPAAKRRFLLSLTEWLAVSAIIAVLVAFLLPAVQQAGSGGPRERCKDNLKQIGLALHLYHQKYGAFPPAYITDENGLAKHSWRVLILPFLGHQQLYDEYRFDEPWDGPHNSKLSEKIVDRFNCHGDKKGPRSPPTPMISYVVILGRETAWLGDTPTRLADITDQMADTILVVETTNSGILWTEPRDLLASQVAFRINSQSASGIASDHIGGAQVLFADGHVEFLIDTLPAATIQAMLTGSRGEDVGERWPARK